MANKIKSRAVTDNAPVKGESRYVEYDEEFAYYGVFGTESGFCYGLYETAEIAAKSF